MIDNEARWEDNFDKIVVSFLDTENKISFEAKVLSIKRLHAMFIYYRIVINIIAAISQSIGPSFLKC